MGHGGKRPGAGRKPGKVTAAKKALSELAMNHAEAALRSLASIATGGESESARVSASVAILDRAYGRPAQSLIHSGPDGGPVQTINATALSTDALRELMAAMNDQNADPDERGSDSD